MRPSPKKTVMALVTALSLLLVLTSPAAADMAEFEAEGTITIQTDPEQVIEIGGETEPHPCSDPDENITVTTSGDATSGTVDITLPPLYFPKPGTTDHDEIRMTTVYDDITYSRVGSSYDYDLSGTMVLYLDVYDIDEETCEKTDYKCTFATALDVAGSVLHNTSPNTALPSISAGATADLVADAGTANGVPLTYLAGGCEEYLALNWVVIVILVIIIVLW